MTDSTILSDATTLDCRQNVIMAVDPESDHFRGPILQMTADTSFVRNCVITADALANVCDGGDDRLRGIMLEGVSGGALNNTIVGINQGPSGCQEGNAIEVRHFPFDGTGTDTQLVWIAHNTVLDYQKTGIVCNGDVNCSVHQNRVGASTTQDNLAANSVQMGFGVTGSVTNNRIDGNQWKGTSAYAATAVLVYLAGDGVEVSNNVIRGNSDIGIYFFAGNGALVNNKVFDVGKDHPNSDYDYGLGNWGSGNVVENNKVRGFEIPYDGVDPETTSNKVIPSPHQ